MHFAVLISYLQLTINFFVRMFFLKRILPAKLIFLGLMVSVAYGQQKAIDSLKKILAVTKTDDTTKVNLLNQISFDSYGVNIPELKTYAAKAIALSLKLKYSYGEALAYKNIGLGYLGSNADPMALEYFDKSLAIFRQLNDKLNSARILNNMGYYYGRIKYHEQERSYLRQALDAVKGLNKTTVEAVILGNIGNSYEDANQPDSALQYYQMAFDKFSKVNQSNSSLIANTNMTSVFLKLKRVDRAVYYANRLQVMLNSKNSYTPKDVAAAYLILGQLNFQQKKYPQSLAFFNQSLVIGSGTGNPETTAEVYRGYYLLDSVKGNYFGALKNYKQYVHLNDSLINVNKSRIVSLYAAKSDLQKRADENEKLKIEQEKDQTIISHQHTTEVILIVGLIIIAVGLIYFISINNQVKIQSKVISEQNKILENNNLVKDKLFSVISHDLRSPITLVIGLLDLWEEGEMRHEEMSELTPVVKTRIVHTLDLLDNLLIWSNNQLQGFKFDASPFDLDGLVNENLSNLKVFTAQKNLRVENAVKPGTIVYADSEMIKIVLRNLITNAIKFTPQNGSIQISSTLADGFVTIAVHDTGIGIKDKDKPKIFSFTSHTTLGTGNEKGTGIGLKICKDFIELNKGRIWMESTEGEGSTFYVSIPQDAHA